MKLAAARVNFYAAPLTYRAGQFVGTKNMSKLLDRGRVAGCPHITRRWVKGDQVDVSIQSFE